MALAVPPGGTPLPPTATSPTGPLPAGRPVSAAVAVSVVIVNFCQWRNTARLVRMLRRSDAYRSGVAEVVVVDNHSPTHPAAARLRRLRGVTVRRFGRNHGFATAVNRGCRLAGGGWVLLLNPDVTAADGFLDDALAAADRFAADPTVGVVGFRLLDPDGRPQPSCGPFPTLAGTVAGLLRPRRLRKCGHAPAADADGSVDWATGGCLLVRRECLDQLGGFDERFFLYYEDVDFCRRAATAGWAVRFDPRPRVTHHWPLHARRVPPPLRLITRHALLTYAAAHWPRWQAVLLSQLVRAEAVVRQTWAAVRRDAGAARLHRQLRRLTADVPAGRLAAARRRVQYAATFLRPIAAAQDGRT